MKFVQALKPSSGNVGGRRRSGSNTVAYPYGKRAAAKGEDCVKIERGGSAKERCEGSAMKRKPVTTVQEVVYYLDPWRSKYEKLLYDPQKARM
jgi:hypothetical protein